MPILTRSRVLLPRARPQTGRELDKRAVTLPEIKALGTYDASIKLHPEVTGEVPLLLLPPLLLLHSTQCRRQCDGRACARGPPPRAHTHFGPASMPEPCVILTFASDPP